MLRRAGDAGSSPAETAVSSFNGQDAQPSRWRPTEAEAQQLAECLAIVYGHDGTWEVVKLDAFPKELQDLVDAGDASDQRYAKREALRQSAPRGVKISRTLAKAKGLL